MGLERDSDKDRSNLLKRGIDFKEARDVWLDVEARGGEE